MKNTCSDRRDFGQTCSVVGLTYFHYFFHFKIFSIFEALIRLTLTFYTKKQEIPIRCPKDLAQMKKRLLKLYNPRKILIAQAGKFL